MTEKAELYFKDGTVVLCTRLTAAYFGVTTATLSNWTRSGCPQLRRGYYDLKAVLDWRAKREERPEMPSDPEQMSAGELRLHYDAQLKQAQFEARQFQNRLAAGEYLPRVQVVRDLSRFLLVLKTAVTGLGRELGLLVSPYVDGDTARRLNHRIDEQIREGLEQIAVGGIAREELDSAGG